MERLGIVIVVLLLSGCGSLTYSQIEKERLAGVTEEREAELRSREAELHERSDKAVLYYEKMAKCDHRLCIGGSYEGSSKDPDQMLRNHRRDRFNCRCLNRSGGATLMEFK